VLVVHSSSATNLSNLTRIHPHSQTRLRRKSISYSLKSSSSHLIIKMSPSLQKTCVYIDDQPTTTMKLTPIMTTPPPEDNHPRTIFNLPIPMQEGLLPRLLAWSLTKLKHNCTSSNNVDSTATFSHSHFAVTRFISNESAIVRMADLESPPPTITINVNPNCNFTFR
jgi:hypothetical protein